MVWYGLLTLSLTVDKGLAPIVFFKTSNVDGFSLFISIPSSSVVQSSSATGKEGLDDGTLTSSGL